MVCCLDKIFSEKEELLECSIGSAATSTLDVASAEKLYDGPHTPEVWTRTDTTSPAGSSELREMKNEIEKDLIELGIEEPAQIGDDLDNSRTSIDKISEEIGLNPSNNDNMNPKIEINSDEINVTVFENILNTENDNNDNENGTSEDKEENEEITITEITGDNEEEINDTNIIELDEDNVYEEKIEEPEIQTQDITIEEINEKINDNEDQENLSEKSKTPNLEENEEISQNTENDEDVKENENSSEEEHLNNTDDKTSLDEDQRIMVEGA